MNRGVLLLVGVLGATASWAQTSRPPLRSLAVAELACSRDGWCTEHPWPLTLTAADGDGRRLVAGGPGGLLVLHEGTWRAGVDTGLKEVTRVELKSDRVLACDARRCVEVSLGEGRLGPILPHPPARPPERPLRPGVFGEAGRYEWKEGQLQVFVQDQRVVSQRALDALGAAGSPLWILQRYDVSRLPPDATGAKGEARKVPISCEPWCWGGQGRLFGDAHAPWLQMPLYLFQGFFRFDGERFSPVFSRGFDEPDRAGLLVGGGCAPCLIGDGRMAVRRPDRWDFIDVPDTPEPKRPASVDPASPWHPLRALRAVGLGEGGWPTLVFDFPFEKEPLPLQTWSFDGTRWSPGSRGARTERVARLHPDRFGKPPGWTQVSEERDGCSVRAPWGERWTVQDTTLTVQGPGGRREERLPEGFRRCEVIAGEHGVFIFEGSRLVSKRWERLSWGEGTGPGTFRVVGVERDDVLQVRRGPDPSAGITTGLEPDTCVEGTGVRSAGAGGTWQKVRGPEGAEGWANARYLRAEPCTPRDRG